MKVLWFISLLALAVAQPACDQQDLHKLWPDYENNRYFYQCVGIGRPFRMPCSSETWFSFYDQTCVEEDSWRPPPLNPPLNGPTQSPHPPSPSANTPETIDSGEFTSAAPDHEIVGDISSSSAKPKHEHKSSTIDYDGPPTQKEPNHPMPPTPPPTAPTMRPTPNPKPQPPKPTIAPNPPTAGADDISKTTTKKESPPVVPSTKKPAKPVPTKAAKVIPTRKPAVKTTKKTKPKVLPTKVPKI